MPVSHRISTSALNNALNIPALPSGPDPLSAPCTPTADIAAALGISDSTAQRCLARALGKLETDRQLHRLTALIILTRELQAERNDLCPYSVH